MDASVAARAAQSRGTSGSAIYAAVAGALHEHGATGGVLADVGCGTGEFHPYVAGSCSRYIGVDVLRFDRLSAGVEFRQADFERQALPLDTGSVDTVVAIETIEHLENPRAFVRELTRVARPGGWIAVTTPNQLSAVSLATLVVRGQFAAFQDGSYPAHRTALLEMDLRRIAAECGLVRAVVRYTRSGRVPLTRYRYPRAISRALPRACSDNVLLIARKPAE